MVLRRQSSPPPLESPAPRTAGNTRSEALPPYWGSWCGPSNLSNVSFTANTTPSSTSHPYNDRTNSPRKTTVEVSTLFGTRERTPAMGRQTNTHTARSGEMSGRNVSLSKVIRLSYNLRIDESTIQLSPGGPPSRPGTRGPDTRSGKNATPDSHESRSLGKAPESAHPKHHLANGTRSMTSGVQSVRYYSIRACHWILSP